MQTNILLMVWIATAFGQTSSKYCLYGHRPDCALECHCAVDAECGGSGVCISGCTETGIEKELKRRWTGDTCQIGNIASGKPANQSSTYPDNNNAATKATDGRSASVPACSITTGGELGEWWLDLGDLHKIYNITIYNRKDCCQYRLSYLRVGVIDHNNKETQCAAIDRETGGSDLVKPLTCQRPLVGRYVHIARYRGVRTMHHENDTFLNFCEVMVIGHKYINCSKANCPDGIPCNDVTGCTECIGTYPPYCTTECDGGFYGINCGERCGNCAEGTTCDKKSGCHQGCKDGFYGQGCNKQCGRCLDTKCNQADGTCPECQLWWGDSKCMTVINRPKYNNESINFSRTNSSINLNWQSLVSISNNLSQYYQYTVRYKQQQASDYANGPSTPHTGNSVLTATISGLDHNTEYDIIIVPQRVIRDIADEDPNVRYGPVSVKTYCNSPNIIGVTVDLTEADLNKDSECTHLIAVSVKGLSDVNHGCDSIKTISLRYRTATDVNFRTVSSRVDNNYYIIRAVKLGRYEVKLTVINNQNLSSYKSEYINLTDQFSGDSNEHVYLYIMVALAVLVLICIGINIFAFIKYRASQAENAELKLQRENHSNIQSDGKITGYEAIKLQATAQRSEQDKAYDTLRTEDHPEGVYEQV